jgi:hypothetical protein
VSTHTVEQVKSEGEQRADFIRAIDDARAKKRLETQHLKNRVWREKYGPAINEKKRLERRASGIGPRVRLPKEERNRRNWCRAHKAKYGITLAEKGAVLAAQGGGCAICKKTEFGKRSPHTDHCHKTGTVRGVLCARCNRGLGYFWDNPELFRTAANYLERSK